ncbi:MAG: hypothetical protein RLZZ326_2085 [Planctomycetota bacterium]|jgi:hypothetical protein
MLFISAKEGKGTPRSLRWVVWCLFTAPPGIVKAVPEWSRGADR